MIDFSSLSRRMSILIPGILILFISSCSQPSYEVFRVGTNLWPGYEPLYLARSNGYYPDNIRLVEYPNATEVLRAFRNNSLEAAALTLDEILVLREYDIPVSIILVTDISEGGDVIVASTDIKDIKQLQGRSVGVESGALGAYMITRALEINDVPLSSLKIKHMGVEQHKQAFIDGKVDAVVTFEPVRTQLVEAGGHIIFSSRDIPGEIVDVIVVHNQFLEKHHSIIQTLIDGWFKAVSDIKEKPEVSAATISERLQITPAQVRASYEELLLPSRKENTYMLDTDKPALDQNINRLKKIMVEHNIIRSDTPVDNLVVDTFVSHPD